MIIQQRTSGTIEILTMAGRLTLGEGCSALREAVRQLVDRKTDLLVDLSGVNYIDSAGLGELVASFNTITAAGREMKLLRPAKRVDSMLHMTRLYSTFEIFEPEFRSLTVTWKTCGTSCVRQARRGLTSERL